jgi:hypothetical protein
MIYIHRHHHHHETLTSRIPYTSLEWAREREREMSSKNNIENDDEEDLLSKIQKLAVESTSSSLSRDDKWWQEFGWTKWNGKEPTMSVRNERTRF